MKEYDEYKRLTQDVMLDQSYQRSISQIEEFEEFLAEMKVSIQKRQILISREDVIPQTLYLNN